MVANLTLLSFNDCVTPVVPVGKTTSPVKVGEAKFAFKSSAACPATLTGLFKSEVLSIFPMPKLVRALLALLPPVPPFAIATTPETLVALPINEPETFPVTLPVTLPVTSPIKFEEITLALKFPLASLFTILLAKFALVALLANRNQELLSLS